MRSGEFYDGFHGSAKWLSGRRGSSGSNGRRAIFDIDSSVGTENSYAAWNSAIAIVADNSNFKWTSTRSELLRIYLPSKIFIAVQVDSAKYGTKFHDSNDQLIFDEF